MAEQSVCFLDVGQSMEFGSRLLPRIKAICEGLGAGSMVWRQANTWVSAGKGVWRLNSDTQGAQGAIPSALVPVNMSAIRANTSKI